MKQIKLVGKLTFIVVLTILVMMGCRSKEMESALIYINQQNDWNKAMEQLEKAVIVNPADTEAHIYLGEGYARQGDYIKMKEHLDTAEKLMSGSSNADPKLKDRIKYLRDKYWVQSFNNGVKFAREEKWEDAKKEFNNCLTIDKNRADSYKNLAYVALRTEDYDEAAKNYEASIQANPKDIEALFALGNVYISQKKYKETIETMDRVLAVKPDTVDAIAQKAMAFDMLGESEKAFAAYEEALKNRPNDKDLTFNLGRLYYMKDDYDNAIDKFIKVLEQDPEDFEANLNTGNAYLSKAEALIKKYREMNDKQLQKVVKDFEADKEKANDFYKKAIPYLEKAIELKPDMPALWNNLGVAYVNAGMEQKGKDAFKKAEELQN